MNYAEFKKLAEGKTESEIMAIISDNSRHLDYKEVYYATYELSTKDGYRLFKASSLDGHNTCYLLRDAKCLSKEWADRDEEVKNLDASSLVGKKIWGNVIANAKKDGDTVKVILESGKEYGFKNIYKLLSLVED